MQDLQNLEKLEIQTLQLLNSNRLLESLFFGGGTMLRLCHNLPRYSTDLDFWITKETNPNNLFEKITEMLSEKFTLIDKANKRNTLLFQFRSSVSQRTMKIEIRKNMKNFEWERKIAFSRFTSIQVPVKALTLSQMLKNKIDALLSRKIIRDAFDIQFLIMRGVELNVEKKKLKKLLSTIKSFNDLDFKVVLGSVLPEKEREYYIKNKFNFLIEEINYKFFPK